MMQVHPDRQLTLREAYGRHYDKSELSPRTAAKIGYELKAWEKFSGDPPIGQIDDATAAEFRATMLKSGLSPRTINSTWGTVRMILRFVGPRETGNPRGRGIISQVPQMKPCKESRPLPRRLALGDLDAVYRACDGAKYPSRTGGVPAVAWWRSLLVLAYFTGLRKSDLLALRRDQFDLQRGLLSFRAQKTGKAAHFPLHPVVVQHLAAIWQPERELVFQGMRSRCGRLYEYLREIQQRAGLLETFGLHDIRRTAASEINRVARGMAPVFLQHVAEDVSGQFYLNATDELEEAIGKMRFPEAFHGSPHAIREAPPKPVDPRPHSINRDDWAFTRGGFIYRGTRCHLEGRLLRLLRLLVTDESIGLDDLQKAIGGKAKSAGRVRQAVHQLRPIVREACGLPEHIDPIPCVARGADTAWQLLVPEFVECEVSA